MASDHVLDIDSLSAPISEQQPAGPYWRDDEECSNKLYPDVDTAMREARTNERKRKEVALFPEGSIECARYEAPDWGAVAESARQLLLRSKDLWVAAWLAEASARQFGFAGLRDGLKLINKLCENYWDEIHPRPDDVDGIRLTIAQIDGDVWSELVLLMPITRNGHSTADYDRSTEMEGLDSEADRDTYRSLGVISTADFESQVGESGAEFLIDLIEDASEAAQEYDALTDFLDQRCGDDAPASSRVKENFQQCLDLIRELGAPYLPSEALEEETTGEGGNDVQRQEREAEVLSTWNRDNAFQQIARLAELFEKFEPNSPVASILRQAVRLGKLTWQELIAGLTEDETTLVQILKQTGIKDASTITRTDRDHDD